VPFDFLRRKKAPEAAAAGTPGGKVASGAAGVAFDGLTEDWRLIGRMMIEGRLSDALNKREPIDIVDVQWGPVDGSEPMVAAPGLKTVDPYDLVVVLVGDDSLPEMTEDGKAAHRVHKVSYEVAIEVPPYRVIGTVYLHPGSEPDSLLSRSSEMFVPIVEATVTMGDRRVGPETASAVLVNRQYIRGVEQVDVRTGERHEKLPGAPLGGTNWTDRA
jgi:hypothetical protein